jgi:glycosyltransferase involved in cell wall biosynthesis
VKKVVILQNRLFHYRTKLFEQLRDTCAMRGIELHLVHGQASRRESGKNDEATLPWAEKVSNRFWEIGEHDIIWQPFFASIKGADLILIMQENRILSNYPLLLSRMWSPRKVAYWGHGKNFQSDAPTGLRERWKNFLLNRVDWWFAYTDVTVDILRGAGFPLERITCLDNSIDNDSFVRDLASISNKRLAELRMEINVKDGSKIGLFCGSLYPDKRLDYMIEAADKVHAEMPDFKLLVLGDGPAARQINIAAASRGWLKYCGMRRGLEKAAYFRLADMVFNPGACGLHILDAFCAGIPIATTVEARHGPEIAYLKDGQNGIVISGGPENYAGQVIKLLSESTKYQYLCSGARETASRYTLKNMVYQFANGIERCLALQR